MVLAEPLQKVTCDNAHCDVFSLLAARPDHEVVAEAKEIQKTATSEKTRFIHVQMKLSNGANVLVLYLLCSILACPASSSLL